MLTDNESGMDLEEAHFYHTIHEFVVLADKYSLEYLMKKHGGLERVIDDWAFDRFLAD